MFNDGCYNVSGKPNANRLAFMDSSIKSHSFQVGSSNFTIKQTEGEVDVNGTKIPHGYVNVSNMCSVGSKQLKDYLKNKDSLSYFEAIVEYETQVADGMRILLPDNHGSFSDSKEYGIQSGLLIETKDAIGGSGEVYAHIEIALDVARWISPVLRMWCNKTVLLVMRGEFIAATPAAVEAQEELLKAYDKTFVRACGRDSSRNWNYYAKERLREFGKTKEEIAEYMARLTSYMYRRITGYTSSDLKANMKLSETANLRDEFDPEISYFIARYEESATAILIRNQDFDPYHAMNTAIAHLEPLNDMRIDFSKYKK